MPSLSPLTPPPLHSLTNLYRADTVGEHSDVIQLKVLPNLIKFCRKSMDIEVRIKAARVLGVCECMLCVCVCVCVCVDSFSTSLKSALPSSLLPLPRWSCLAPSHLMTPPSYLTHPYPFCHASSPSITAPFLLPFPCLSCLFLSHHEVLKGLLVQLLNESQNPSLVEQIFILILK